MSKFFFCFVASSIPEKYFQFHVHTTYKDSFDFQKMNSFENLQFYRLNARKMCPAKAP